MEEYCSVTGTVLCDLDVEVIFHVYSFEFEKQDSLARMKFLSKCLIFQNVLSISPGSNRVECDPNASMTHGCHLLEHSGKWVTSNCTEGYQLTVDMECIQPCAMGEYLFGGECLPCAMNCNTCFGPSEFQCSECDISHTLNFQSFCAYKCDKKRRLYGIAKNETSANNQCYECDSSCGECFQGYETACTACPVLSLGTGISLKVFDYAVGRTDSGYCLRDPSIDYSNYYRTYPSDLVIIECPYGCTKCVDRFKCTACKEGFILYPDPSEGAGYSLCYSR